MLFTSLLESFGGLDLDEPPEVEDTEIVKLSVKEKTESEKLQDELEPISEEKIVDEVKVDNSSSEPQLKLSNKDQEKLSSFAGLMESFGALLDEPPQLEDEKVFEMKIEDVYPEENKEKIEEKKKVETSKLHAFEKLFTEFAKEQEKIDEEALNLKVTDIYPEKPKVVEIQEVSKKVITKPKVEKPKVDVKKTSNIIEKVISNLDSMKGKTQVKEQVDQITLLRNEFNQFRTVIQNQIANQKVSFAGGGSGSGEVRFEFLDDVDRDSVKVNNKYLKYNSTTGKFVGSDPNLELDSFTI